MTIEKAGARVAAFVRPDVTNLQDLEALVVDGGLMAGTGQPNIRAVFASLGQASPMPVDEPWRS